MPGLGQLSKEAAERKLKEGISGHRTGLPKKLLELFEPRDALEFKPPVRKRPPKVLGIHCSHQREFIRAAQRVYQPNAAAAVTGL